MLKFLIIHTVGAALLYSPVSPAHIGMLSVHGSSGVGRDTVPVLGKTTFRACGVASPAISGIPNLPNTVAVIPFVVKVNETAAEKTKVVIPAAVDGWCGNFAVDLGAPELYLNRTFLQPNASGGVDSVTENNRIPDRQQPNIIPPTSDWERVRVKMRIGTLDADVSAVGMKTPNLQGYNAYLNHMWGNFSWVFAPRLGNIGLSILEQFETILDYTHHRVVLIRLDSVGRRMADVPAYAPRWSGPLVPFMDIGPPAPGVPMEWWGVQLTVDSVRALFYFDNGNTENHISDTTKVRIAMHFVDTTLDRFSIGGRTFNNVPFAYGENVLGYPFLSSLGVVGFNHRTHQFILYNSS